MSTKTYTQNVHSFMNNNTKLQTSTREWINIGIFLLCCTAKLPTLVPATTQIKLTDVILAVVTHKYLFIL